MIEIIDIPIYRCSVIYLVESTKEDWFAFCKKHTDELSSRDELNVADGIGEGLPGFVCNTEGNDYVCYISNKSKAGLVAHELFHAANAILWDKGYKSDKESEPLAYLLEFLMDAFCSKINDS